MRFEKITDVMILGAGASGSMAAIAAARSGASVVVADGNEKTGKKLYATGNGRCNFTNANCSADDFNDPADGFVSAVLAQFPARAAIDFFEEIGMLAREEQEGRCYPYSGQAASVVAVLEKEMQSLGVRVILGDAVTGCSKNEEGLFVTALASGAEVLSRTVIVACGGRAGLAFGSTGDGYGFAKAFGHSLKAPHPALTGVMSDDALLAELRGRARAKVTLFCDGAFVCEEQGEVQFTKVGLSGICVMDLTRFMETPRPAGKKKKKKKDGPMPAAAHRYEIAVDLVPDKSEEELAVLLERWAEGRSLAEAAGGVINSKTADVLMDGVDSIEECVRRMKDLRVTVASTMGWNEAQVTCGGVRREEIVPETMASKLTPGLFFCGEVLDVDGRCGGYNLQWAWASGMVSGRCAAEMSCGQMKG